MKKTIISILFLTLFFAIFTANIYSQEYNVEALAIFQEKGNLADEETWLPDQCARRLKSNLLKYTDFKVLSSKQDAIINFQKVMETSGLYKEDNINLGQFTNASHAIFITVGKFEKKYSVSVSVISVTTNEEIFSESLEKDDKSEIYSENGNAIDEITIELCEKLGQPLSKSVKDILKYGEGYLTNDTLLQMHQEEIEKNKTKLEELEAEKLAISQDSSELAIARQEEIELELAQTKAKEKRAKEAKERAEEELMLEKIEKERAENRTEEQTRKIKETSNSINKKIQEVRDMKMQNASLSTQLYIIESLKQSYENVRNKTKAEKYRIDKENDNLIKETENRIMNAPVGNTDKDSQGNMLERERIRRNNKINKETERILNQGEKDKREFEVEMENSRKTLLSEIQKGYSALKKNQTITTLTKDLIVNFGNYDGERFGWDLYITVQNQDMIIYQTKSFLSYETLTGKKHFVTTEVDLSAYEKMKDQDYRDTVDYYFSMFARGEPILTFALDYNVTPAPQNEPSKYSFSFSNLRYYETTELSFSGNKINGSGTKLPIMGEENITKQLYPAYDIRDEKTISMENEAKRIADEEAMEELKKEEEKAKKKAESKAKRDAFFAKDWGRTLIGAGGGFLVGNIEGSFFEAEISYGFWPIMYIGYTMDFMKITKDETRVYNFYGNKSIDVFSNMFEVGINMDSKSFGFFASCGIGFNAYTPKVTIPSGNKNRAGYPVSYDNENNKNTPKAVSPIPDTQFDFIVSFSGGLSFILFNHLDLNVSVDYRFMPSNSDTNTKKKETSSSKSKADELPPGMIGITLGAAFRL